MATVGEMLDEFFSPFSKEKLWIMPESDNYTGVVRGWQAVKDASDRTKANLAIDCARWQAGYVTNPAWVPMKTDAPKPGAYREFVPSPPGTDPTTCEKAFIVYAASMAPSALPVIQTRNLYLCAVGSFNIYTTVDRIDCTAKKAKLNFWMYNSMSKKSFGKFASNRVFALCGMKTQYMWWNWSEIIDWSSGTVQTLPSGTSAPTAPIESGW